MVEAERLVVQISPIVRARVLARARESLRRGDFPIFESILGHRRALVMRRGSFLRPSTWHSRRWWLPARER